MSNQEDKKDIVRQYREKQDKFVYYIAALSVAAIGFSISQTINEKLNCYHALVGGALIFWVVSIFCGFQFLQIVLKGLDANSHYFDTIEGRVGNIKPGTATDKIASQVLREKADKYSVRSSRNFLFQQIFFYAGLFLFVAWHIIRMYNK